MCQDYRNSYYPTVLPLRKPNSGDIGMLVPGFAMLYADYSDV